MLYTCLDGGKLINRKTKGLMTQLTHGSHRDWKSGKTWKMGRHFPVREKSGNFVKTGKIREFYSEYWENGKNLYWKIEKDTGKLFKKYWKSQGNLSVRKSGNHADSTVVVHLFYIHFNYSEILAIHIDITDIKLVLVCHPSFSLSWRFVVKAISREYLVGIYNIMFRCQMGTGLLPHILIV